MVTARLNPSLEAREPHDFPIGSVSGAAKGGLCLTPFCRFGFVQPLERALMTRTGLWASGLFFAPGEAFFLPSAWMAADR